MKKALIIAHLFPPYGGVGVMRALGFVKYLHDFGWEPVILAAHAGKVGPQDPSLLAELPKDIKIYRQFYIESIWLRRFFKLLRLDKFGTWLENFLFIPDPQILWLPFVYKKALKIIKEENINLIFSTSAPYSSHLLANKLKQKTGLPWVADFRDWWSGNPHAVWPTKIHKTLAKQLEKKVLQNADLVTTVSPQIRQELAELSGTDSQEKFILITNGFDAQTMYKPKDSPANKKFTIRYLGSIFSSRPPIYFFQAIQELLNEKKLNSENLLVEFVGNIHLPQIPEYLSIKEKLGHGDFLEQVSRTDLLLLISEHPGMLTGKFFEYLITGKFILGLVQPKADIIRFFEETGCGATREWADVKGIKELIMTKFIEWQKTGTVKNELTWEKIKKYSRQNLTAQLTELFNGLFKN